MTDDIRDLLRRWGVWMRAEDVTPKGIGYPSQAIGAEAMAPPPSRKEHEQREADRLSRVARKQGTYRQTPDGGRERVRPMIEQTQPKDCRSRKPRSPEYEPAPLDIQQCHNAIKQSRLHYQAVIYCKYAAEMRADHAARALRMDVSEYRGVLEAAERQIETMLVRGGA